MTHTMTMLTKFVLLVAVTTLVAHAPSEAKTTTSTTPFERRLPTDTPSGSSSRTSTPVITATENDIAESMKQLVTQLLFLKEMFVKQALAWLKAGLFEVLAKAGLVIPAEKDRVRKSSPWTESHNDAGDEAEVKDADKAGVLLSFMGKNVRYEDLAFVERIVLDTVDVIKAWQSKFNSVGSGDRSRP